MIFLDTNLLIYAHRSATPEHSAARSAIERASESPRGCGIALPSIAEFFSIVTHPAALGEPSSPVDAATFLEGLEEGGVVVVSPGPAFARRLFRIASELRVVGPRIFDLQIALCALDGGATEIWTHDHNFVPVPGLIVFDPLVTT